MADVTSGSGTSWSVKIPPLSDPANIQTALNTLYWGSSSVPASDAGIISGGGIAWYLKNLNSVKANSASPSLSGTITLGSTSADSIVFTGTVSTAGINIASTGVYKIAGTTVLEATKVLGYGVSTTSTGSASIVLRDASGNFSASTITATTQFSGGLVGNVTGTLYGNVQPNSAVSSGTTTGFTTLSNTTSGTYTSVGRIFVQDPNLGGAGLNYPKNPQAGDLLFW